MRRAVIFVAIGLILLGIAGWIIFPDVRSDILERLPFFNSEPQAVTLKYWGLWEPREVIQSLLEQYQSENPNITIEYEEKDPEDYAQQINSRFGIEGGPDIVRVHNTWLPLLVEKLAPLPTEVMSVEEYEATFYPVNAVFQKKSNKYYAIPLMVEGLALIYNRDIFTANGVSNPPQDWETFRELAKLLTQKNSSGEIVQAGAAMGYADNIDYFSDIIGLMLAQNGVQFQDEEGRVTFHNSISPVGGNLAVEALRFYNLFASDEQSWDPTWGNSTDEFAQGRVAMVLLPSHRILKILADNPDFAVGVAPVPQLPVAGDSGQVGWANYWVEAVSATASSTTEAWKLLKWMSEKEQLTNMYRLASNIRPFGEPYSRQDLASALNADKYVLPYVEQGSIYTTWLFCYGVEHPQFNSSIVSELQTMVNNINAMDEDQTYEGIINRAATQIGAIIDQNYPK